MTEFRITFGQQYPREPHPTLALAHRDGWVAIYAPDESAARAEAIRVLDVRWSMLYDPTDPGYPTTEDYPKGELLALIAPTGRALALLTGEHEDETLLIHVWRDGTGEVATRRDGRWGVPSMLTVAP